MVVSHSNLFYWWPVWACGFLLGLISFFGQASLVVLPHGWVQYREVVYERTLKDGTKEKMIGPGIALPPNYDIDSLHPRHSSPWKGPGIIFFTVLLLVMFITNVPLRGMWSYLVIISLALVALILHLWGVWEHVLVIANLLDIRMNAGAYIFFSAILFVLWFITVVFFDRRTYIVFTPGQLRVCTQIGEGERVFSANGLALEKKQSDLFRHRILGLGAGDLIVKTAGAQAHVEDLPNVLFIDSKVRAIEKLMRTVDVRETR